MLGAKIEKNTAKSGTQKINPEVFERRHLSKNTITKALKTNNQDEAKI